MLDIQFIRDHPDLVQEGARRKRIKADITELLALDTRRRDLVLKLDEAAHRRNLHAKSVAVKRGKVSEAENAAALAEGRDLKAAASRLGDELSEVERSLKELLSRVPNIPTNDTPVGDDESGNRVLRTVGEPTTFNFRPKEHWELGRTLGLLDMGRAAKVSGSRFSYLAGDAVLLELALLHFSFSVLTNTETLKQIIANARLDVTPDPFIPIIPPALIRPKALQRMARLEPRDERYHITGDDLYLVGSAEHTLGALHMDETLSEDTLPRRYVGFSPAFRREAGSYGKDVHGILRVHQFDKVEMESFTVPEKSLQEQEFFIAIQEYLMKSLELPYRVVLLCTGDMGAPNARQVDLEAWFPGQQRYRETHSADLMTDYQARRLNTKVRRLSGPTVFAHMNDATVVAIGRTLAAIFENYQQADGRIHVPTVLQPYLGGFDMLRPSPLGTQS